jgi:hypothetical protein
MHNAENIIILSFNHLSSAIKYGNAINVYTL